MGRRTYNFERRAWRGVSYKVSGRDKRVRVRQLREKSKLASDLADIKKCKQGEYPHAFQED